jgi:hypothetical protein
MIPYLTSLLFSLASLAATAAGDSRAADLLNQARAALGGDAALSAVHALSCEGTFRRSAGERDFNGSLTLDVELPDKMLRTETMRPMGDATIVMEQGVNGQQLLRNARTIGGGPGMVVRMGTPTDPASEAEAVTAARADLARFAYALLLTPPAGAELLYAGEAQSDDGRADMIDAAGPGGFRARIFLDHASHRPLMMTYRGVPPRLSIMARQHGDPHGGDAAPHDADAPHGDADIALYFDDYRAVNGVSLPHHFSRAVDGQPVEEWTFTTIHINPAFKAGTFTAK